MTKCSKLIIISITWWNLQQISVEVAYFDDECFDSWNVENSDINKSKFSTVYGLLYILWMINLVFDLELLNTSTDIHSQFAVGYVLEIILYFNESWMLLNHCDHTTLYCWTKVNNSVVDMVQSCHIRISMSLVNKWL